MRVLTPALPSGSVTQFAGTVLPSGWLWCDGSAVSRTVYGSLFNAIGTAWGNGDGSTTFHLPDMRGRFARGADNMGTGAAGRDPDAGSRTASNAGGSTGNNIGSVQSGSNASHNHGQNTGFNTSQVRPHVGVSGLGSSQNGWWATGSFSNVTSNRVITDSDGGSESRPQNAAFGYIIKI